MKTIRPTKDIALETLYGNDQEEPGLINELILLTQESATVEQLQEAIQKADLILRTLRIWHSSVRLINAAPHRCPVISRAEIDEARNCRSAYFQGIGA